MTIPRAIFTPSRQTLEDDGRDKTLGSYRWRRAGRKGRRFAAAAGGGALAPRRLRGRRDGKG
jgi:hypothetical protein